MAANQIHKPKRAAPNIHPVDASARTKNMKPNPRRDRQNHPPGKINFPHQRRGKCQKKTPSSSEYLSPSIELSDIESDASPQTVEVQISSEATESKSEKTSQDAEDTPGNTMGVAKRGRSHSPKTKSKIEQYQERIANRTAPAENMTLGNSGHIRNRNGKGS